MYSSTVPKIELNKYNIKEQNNINTLRFPYSNKKTLHLPPEVDKLEDDLQDLSPR